MPIYEYQCVACEHKLEIIQKFSDDLLTKCPECGEDSLRKLVSAVSFRLKGTGWYETDFKDKPKNSNKENSNKENKSSGKETDKTDKKTDTGKSDSKESSSSSSSSSSSNNSSSSSDTKASNSSS